MTKTQLDAWTVRALSDAIGINAETVERAMDQDVAAGNSVRLTQGTFTFYVPGQLGDALDALGARPVEGERLEKRRAKARRIRVVARVDEIDRRAEGKK